MWEGEKGEDDFVGKSWAVENIKKMERKHSKCWAELNIPPEEAAPFGDHFNNNGLSHI